MGRQGLFRLQLLQGPPINNRRQFNDVIKRIYAPEESNIIPQCSAGPGGTRPDLLVLQVGCPWQGKPSGM
jgi:hypothetical protein